MTLRTFTSIIASCLFLSNAYATTLTTKSCQDLEGFWVGEEHIRDQNLCDAFGGCTHMITVKVRKKGDTVFTLEDRWSDGQRIHTDGEVPFTCINGKITLPTTENFDFDASCYNEQECFATINNPRFTAELVKH